MKKGWILIYGKMNRYGVYKQFYINGIPCIGQDMFLTSKSPTIAITKKTKTWIGIFAYYKLPFPYKLNKL